jgi:hypothetical protein
MENEALTYFLHSLVRIEEKGKEMEGEYVPFYLQDIGIITHLLIIHL